MGMTDETSSAEQSPTSPPEPTHEATTPPGNPEADPDRVRQAEEELQKPGAGH
jgi:hypothetical protein